jgi:hypothetical protein
LADNELLFRRQALEPMLRFRRQRDDLEVRQLAPSGWHISAPEYRHGTSSHSEA